MTKIQKLEDKVVSINAKIEIANNLIKSETDKELIEALEISKKYFYEKLAKSMIKLRLLKDELDTSQN